MGERGAHQNGAHIEAALDKLQKPPQAGALVVVAGVSGAITQEVPKELG